MTKLRQYLGIALVGLLFTAAVAYFGFEQAPLLRRNTQTPSLVPGTWGSVHESPGHMAHVGKGNIVCKDCHDESDAGFRSLKEAACTTSCHAKEVARTHAGSVAKPTTCLTCHAFGTTAAPTCLECHSKAQGKRAAVAVHIKADAPCTTCHNPHVENKAVQADCATCHKDVTATHGTMHVATKRTTATNGTCSDCHAPHAHAVDARGSCKGCHEHAPQENKPSGHPACVTCHEPHDLERTAVKACVGCHQAKQAAITPSHVACRSCHAPHATATAKTACTNCHAEKVTLGAPKVEAHVACASCHKPHDPKASPAAACVTCHATLSVKHEPGHSDKCTACHTMHPGRGAALAIACTNCHKQGVSNLSGHPKGVTCTGCHKPHEFALSMAKGAFCASCHASETKIALASHGHNECAKCHSDIHKPTRGAACATCHAAEASSAPTGHQDCQSCHQPHDGHMKPNATCQSCHAQEAATKHGQVQGACATCHKPHGPNGPKGPSGAVAAPACTTCHEPTKLPGLHKLVGKTPPGHTQCANCHSSHQPTRADRATCTTSCHENRKNHQPAATECNGCHIFRRP